MSDNVERSAVTLMPPQPFRTDEADLCSTSETLAWLTESGIRNHFVSHATYLQHNGLGLVPREVFFRQRPDCSGLVFSLHKSSATARHGEAFGNDRQSGGPES